jgi:hypothetical protein
MPVVRTIRVSGLVAFLSLIAVNTAFAQLTFGTATSYPTGQSTLGAATADLNHDNHADLVVLNPADKLIRVRLGDGSGVLGPEHDFVVGGTAVGPVPAGTYDLVVYAHSSVSGTWAARRIVRIVVTP